MLWTKIHHALEAVMQRLRTTSAAATFILVNGLVIGAVTFGLLFFTSMEISNKEARNTTREAARLAENSLAEIEKIIRGLGYFYASLRQEGNKSPASINVQRLLADEKKLDAILWVTDRGTWIYEDILGNSSYDRYDETLGWPDFQKLNNLTFVQPLNQLGFLSSMNWLKPIRAPGSDTYMPIGLTLKIKLPDDSTGILLIVTTPEKMFSMDWRGQRNDIARVEVWEHFSGKTLLDDVHDERMSGAVGNQNVEYALMFADKTLQMRFEVIPTAATQIIHWAPWVAFAVISFLTLTAAFSAERKNRQDIKLEEMSKTLQGAHHELQSSISERDKLFYALRKSERENRALINSVSDIIFETDENGKILFLNETWKRIAGQETETALGSHLFSMMLAADRGKYRDMFEELVRGERQAFRIETYLDFGTGIMKPVEIAFSMLRMAEDKSMRIVGTITDIEKRRKAELALRETEYRFRSMFENAINGFYQSSPDGRYISVNPAMAEILGYSSAEDLMESVYSISQQLYVRPEESKQFVQKLLFEGRITNVEIEMFRKDGKKIWVMENARIVRNDRGGIYCYEGSVTDITERKAAEEAMRNARLMAEMSSRSRMEFLANMSHELRTPLNAIIGFSEIIKDEIMGQLSVPAYKEYARDIYDSGNYLLKVISEILEVSKIESGNRELNVSNFHLSKALKSCMTIMSTRVEESQVKVNLEIPDTLPQLMAEELGFKQIMLNLIGNAIKFTKKGGQVTVSAMIGRDGDMIIDVKDTGIGMTADEITKAMQPFSKIDNNFSTMKAGTGLGLTIVDSLVRLHGGEFRLLSEKGVGTTARIIMPAYRVFHLDENGKPQLSVIR